MNLSVLDRIALLSLLPQEADYATIRIVHDLKQDLSFTEEEHKLLGIQVTPEGGMRWDGGIDREYDFGPRTTTLIVDVLEKADKSKKLSEDHLHVYELFMEGA